MSRASIASVAAMVACGTGLIHAASSLYWAVGGTWLLDTVGQWAVDLVERSPLEAGFLLGIIAIVKAVASIVPVLVDRGRMPRPRFWRALCWVGGPVLVVYGGVNVVVSVAVLTGFLTPDGGYETAATVGHAFLWDPLFFVWGCALVAVAVADGRPRYDYGGAVMTACSRIGI